MASLDSFKCRKTLTVGAKTYEIYSLKAAEKNGLAGVSQLPFSLKIVLENLLRNEDGRTVKKEDIEAVAAWIDNRGKKEHEIAFRPARVLMQDFTGVPAVVDLAAMRDAMVALKGDPDKINPLVPVDLVIDHSVVVDYFGTGKSLAQNVAREYEQNQERYRFLKWGQQGFSNFRVVPPGTGICHQVNLEYLAQTVWTAKEKRNGKTVEVAFPDTLVGTDSHTTMVNGLAVLGWGVGRHRGRGRHARPAPVDAAARGDRLQARGRIARGRDRDRPRADRDADAAQEGRGRQVRRVLRRGPQCDDGRRSRHDRQYGAGIWRDLRPLPDRRPDARLSQDHRPQTFAARSGRSRMRKRKARSAPASRPIRSIPTRSRSTSAKSRPRSPGRSGRRTAWS